MMDKDPVIEKMAMDIAATVGSYTKTLLSQGFDLPMHVTQMTRDGAFVFARYFKNEATGKLTGETLKTYWPSGAQPFPIYFLYVDHTGRSHSAILAAKDQIKPLLPDSGIVH